jgi:flagellar basal-body rod modification protein FlgD
VPQAVLDQINSDNLFNGDFSISRIQADAKADKSEKNQFMDLLVAQLQNQNPLEPKEGAEFLSQLAQFSTVDGIERLNTSMSDLSSGFRSGQALQATALVGRKVEVDSNIGLLGSSGGLAGSVAMDQPMVDVRIQIKDSAGALVKELPLGTQASGSVHFQWDGTNAAGEPMPLGEYLVEAVGVADGESQQLRTLVGVNVDSVTLGGQGEVSLNLRNGTTVSLDQVRNIN